MTRYGYYHRKLRAALAPRVATGTVNCWRCKTLIRPDEPWDLGHADEDPTVYRGPEHANRCNRSTAATRGNLARAKRNVNSRDWLGGGEGGTRTTG